jgi:hypothetical protein
MMMDRDSLIPGSVEPGHFSEGEIKYLVNLIGEYTEKLRARSEAVRRDNRRRILVYACMLLACMAVVTLWLLYWGSEVDVPATVAIASLAASSILIVFCVLSLHVSRRDSWVSRESDEAWGRRFEELVRFASQIEDHGAVDLTHRIALMLTLGDAEGALRQSEALHRRTILP